jgi:hypothetical protein
MKWMNNFGTRLSRLALAALVAAGAASLGGGLGAEAKIVRDHRPDASTSRVRAHPGQPIAKPKRTPVVRGYRPNAGAKRVRATSGKTTATPRRTPVVRDYRPGANVDRARARPGRR